MTKSGTAWSSVRSCLSAIVDQRLVVRLKKKKKKTFKISTSSKPGAAGLLYLLIAEERGSAVGAQRCTATSAVSVYTKKPSAPHFQLLEVVLHACWMHTTPWAEPFAALKHLPMAIYRLSFLHWRNWFYFGGEWQKSHLYPSPIFIYYQYPVILMRVLAHRLSWSKTTHCYALEYLPAQWRTPQP